MAPPAGYYTAVMQLPATLVANHDGDEEYSTSTSEEIEVGIQEAQLRAYGVGMHTISTILHAGTVDDIL